MKTILVVDDRAANREFLSSLLTYKAYRVVEAADGMEALNMVRGTHPDLVICDILMPSMDGFEFVRRLRSESIIARTPVVFCTAHYLEREAATLASQCGVSDVIIKPAEPQVVLDTIEKVLANPGPALSLPPPDALHQEHIRLVTDKLSRTANDLENATHRMAALIDLNLRLASETDPQRLLDEVCLGARQLFGARHGALGVRDRDASTTTRFVTSGFPREFTQAFGLPAIDRGILGDVLGGGRPYRVSGVTVAPAAAGLPEGYPPVTSLLAVPVLSPTGIFGWLCLTDKLGAGEFTGDEERLLGILGMQTGRIYENGSLYRKIQRHAAEVEIEIAERIHAEKELRESEAKYRSLIEQASDGIFISDAEGYFLMVNTRGCELLGYAPEDMIGLNGKVTYLESELDVHTQRMKAVVAGEDLRYERMVKRKDGSTFPAEISLKMLDNRMVQVIFHDISKRRAQEEKIGRLSRIQSVLSGINSAIVRIRDRQELLEEACRIAAMHGAFRIAVIGLRDANGEFPPCAWDGAGGEFFRSVAAGKRVPALNPAGVAVRAIRQRQTVFDNDITGDPASDEIRAEAVRHGSKSVIALPLLTEGEVAGIFVLYSSERNAFDEEEIKLLEELAGDVSFALTFIAQQEKVDYLAYYDSLTGLPNRSLFFDRLGRQMAAAERERVGCVLALLDIDRFRMINETWGRQAGDALIKAIAERLLQAVRGEDTVARMGADRFAIVVSGNWATSDITSLVESRSRALFGKPFVVGGEEVRVAATAGVAVYPADATGPEAMVANAEAALRNAKKQSVPLLFYSPGMNAKVAEALRMESRLRQAVAEQQLELWYQPKVDLKTRKVRAMEALMRWRDPESGLIPPVKFIPVMEQTGLILDAGNWALAQAAVDCREWTRQGVKAPRIAVNVSPIQLRQKDFVTRVIEAAENAEAAGGALDLEITESVIMENVDEIIPKLQTIAGLGVEIYIDDFGTGYSSLAYIARLPIHALKIDRSFVVGMTQTEDSLNIVNSVISLAHSLKLRVVAEGVETEAQATLLAELRCDQFQGYLVSKPLPPGEVPALLKKLA